VRILVVCTANICRSPSVQRLLVDALAEDAACAGIEVRSAGTLAIAGAPGCTLAPALAGRAEDHRSTPLTADLVDWADLILTAARDHRSAVVTMVPAARTRTFTVRQAARIADWLDEAGMLDAARQRAATPEGWSERFPPGDPRREVLPLPQDPDARWGWLVEELDAARGVVSAAVLGVGPEAGEGAAGSEGANGRGRRWLRGRGAPAAPPEWMHPDDVPDPHVHGMHLHPMAHESIVEATGSVAALIRWVAAG
jgi:protein-tyrosine phosphatase